jgi:hypothetical protein
VYQLIEANLAFAVLCGHASGLLLWYCAYLYAMQGRRPNGPSVRLTFAVLLALYALGFVLLLSVPDMGRVGRVVFPLLGITALPVVAAVYWRKRHLPASPAARVTATALEPRVHTGGHR